MGVWRNEALDPEKIWVLKLMCKRPPTLHPTYARDNFMGDSASVALSPDVKLFPNSWSTIYISAQEQGQLAIMSGTPSSSQKDVSHVYD